MRDQGSSPPGGVLLLDKPAGPSSFAMIRLVRRLTSVARVGHCGTLDPFASGLLVVCVGREATRLVSLLMGTEKEYVATLQLGIETETQDPEGRVLREAAVPPLDAAAIELVLHPLRGRRLQQPPRYSALKHQGKPLYHYARRGIDVTKPPRTIEIHKLEDLGLATQARQLMIRVVCSPGTYIRTLAEEIGRALGCGAHLVALRRLRSGALHVRDAVAAAELTDEGAGERLRGRLLPVARFRPAPPGGDGLDFP